MVKIAVKEIGHRKSDIESAIEEAVLFLPENFSPRHEHSKRCYNILKHILYKDEYTVIEANQSLLKSFAPIKLVATNHRLIIVKPSFWSLWIGRNILTPTRYESIPYNSIINITLYTGMNFSSLHIHLNTVMMDEGDVDGLKTDDAKAIFVFLEKMTKCLNKSAREAAASKEAQPQDKRSLPYVDLETARRLVKYSNSKFVWLGMEPLEEIAEKLDVDSKAIVKINSDELAHMQDPERLKGCIFVCYNDSFSAQVSRFIKERYGIDSYILVGGIEYQKQKILNLKDLAAGNSAGLYI